MHRLLAFAYLEDSSFEPAIRALESARSIDQNSETEIAFGRFLNKQGHKQAALNCFLSALVIDPNNGDACALACMLHAQLGSLDLALPYGQKSLEMRDRQAGKAPMIVSKTPPAAFNPSSPNQNIISFSLFGDNSYYWESAIAAAAMAVAIFPEWRCRFYCDPKVPENIRQSLLRLRAQLFISPENSKNWSALFWRFYAFDDPKVNVVMVRDVDSPFTLRERFAVEEWLASGFPFHVIRDHCNHTEPIMAGLWGGWTRLLPPMKPLIDDYLDQTKDRFADQEFLRLSIWPRIRHATLAHDRYFRLGETRPPPRHPTEASTHIGMAWPRGARTSSERDDSF